MPDPGVDPGTFATTGKHITSSAFCFERTRSSISGAIKTVFEKKNRKSTAFGSVRSDNA
jgi:hypothetical protein